MDASTLRPVRALLLDLDGTLYLGDRLFDWTPGFLDACRACGVRPLFMTNNSSRSPAQYVEKLNRLGIPATAADIVTSGQSAMLYLTEHPELRRICVLGTESLAGEVRAAGREVVHERADAVLVGFATNLTFEALCEASWALQHGARFLATHPDPACPDPRGLLPDAGSLIRCLESASGRTIDHVFGKPSAWMLRVALERAGVARDELAVVGDRLMTDVRMGRDHGIMSVLVLSGATRPADVETSEVVPDLTVDHVGKLGRLLQAAREQTS